MIQYSNSSGKEIVVGRLTMSKYCGLSHCSLPVSNLGHQYSPSRINTTLIETDNMKDPMQSLVAESFIRMMKMMIMVKQHQMKVASSTDSFPVLIFHTYLVLQKACKWKPT